MAIILHTLLQQTVVPAVSQHEQVWAITLFNRL